MTIKRIDRMMKNLYDNMLKRYRMKTCEHKYRIVKKDIVFDWDGNKVMKISLECEECNKRKIKKMW